MKDDRHFCEAPLSPARQAWLMLVVIAPIAACYPAIKAGLEFAPSSDGWPAALPPLLHPSFGVSDPQPMNPLETSRTSARKSP